MNYRIFENGVEINTIASNSDFVSSYCERNGYTYELIQGPEPTPEPTPRPSTEEILLEMAADHEERLCLIELGI